MNRGLPLDDGIPGTKTFVKPLDDDGKIEPKDDSPHRVDSPRELGKDRGRIDVNDQSRVDPPNYMGGPGTPERSPKTKYPYRDGIPNAHNASASFVAGLFQLESVPDISICSGSRSAATISQMVGGLNPEFAQRAQSCAVALKRADLQNLRWIFTVNAGNGPRVVRLKADRKGNVTQFSKLDLKVACSCPAWRWLGPEFHASTKNYQDPGTALQGTASTPNVRDPERQNLVCKHVAAVLQFAEKWAIPPKKKG